ncbi:hypothetical protein [Hymenobacter weizhouensis]|uniref:hypothetical protein n=1 Tax=Hymenobacter sp. YIM 151500-1 TaxID=2987689 RepID=UPI0022276254|nr:hypothetical protein [Hymenobacter sp. YIM 151500-1]UYZ64088.1 hypothetical protein OIS53_04385 [Hymenobacter sp. YIM 151500-1]
MPKTIDYPRTSYQGAWEVAEVVDDTGGKCAIETAARKLNRKVSGSFKAIIGSAVKFGLLTSKREFLTTTNLFRRIKHAYDKQEEKIYHREAFLHPPLFTQICRKFRNRELPVHMFDVMLIREFGVEEINAQSVAKAFIDGARMAGIIDERNVIADIDQLAAQQAPRRELSSTEMPANLFKAGTVPPQVSTSPAGATSHPVQAKAHSHNSSNESLSPGAGFVPAAARGSDAVSSLFGLDTDDLEEDFSASSESENEAVGSSAAETNTHPVSLAAHAANELAPTVRQVQQSQPTPPAGHLVAADPSAPLPNPSIAYTIRISGPGMDTQLSVQELDDLDIVEALLGRIRRRLGS